MSSKIDTLEPNSSEPLAILLASIVASISTHDSAPGPLDEKPAGDIARHAELAIAGVPLGLACGIDVAGGAGVLRVVAAARFETTLGQLRDALRIARHGLALLRTGATQSARKYGSKLLQEMSGRRESAHAWLVSGEKSRHVKIGAAATAALASSLVLVQLSSHAGWFLPSRNAGPVTAQPDISIAAQTVEEHAPGIGEVEFTRANIRYCTFQQIRLEALGPITEGADLVVFNALVEDWNARCTKYHYRPKDKAAVDAEAGRRRALLEVEGRALMNGWRRKIVTTVQQRPAAAFGEAGVVDSETDAAPERTGDAAESLPLLITLGRAVPEDADRVTGLSLRTPALALLRADVAMRVQRRLNDLGYTIFPVDGTWGTMSRTALARFKKANGLLVNDAFDAETVTRLFSTSAKNAPAGAPEDETATIETTYPPPPAATLNPLNRADGQRIQQRLVELGYYTGRGDGSWGTASRTALRSFKAASGLPADEEWNAMAEAVLFDDQAVHAGDATIPAPRAAVTPAAPAVVPLPPKRPPPPARAAEAARPPGFLQALSRLFGSATRASP